MLRRALAFLLLVSIVAGPAFSQSATKLRVLTAPGVTQVNQKDWKNSLVASGEVLTLNCPKCSPIQSVALQKADVAGVRYGQNAYHHWVAGIVTGVFSLGAGLIVGLAKHHEHFFSIDTTDGRAIGIQADKGDYKEIAGLLENFSGQPIKVTEKDAHFLHGFNTQIVGLEESSRPGKTGFAPAPATANSQAAAQSAPPPGSCDIQIAAGTTPGPDSAAASSYAHASDLVMAFLNIAAKEDTSATRAFLSVGCHSDLVKEFQANDASHWSFDAATTKIASETSDSASGKATVVTNIAFKGGNPPTFMVVNRKFFLVMEGQSWKISKMDPEAKTTGPGVMPLN